MTLRQIALIVFLAIVAWMAVVGTIVTVGKIIELTLCRTACESNGE